VQVRAATGDTKSRAGKRTVGLPDPLIGLFRAHKLAQDAERLASRQLWRDEGWVFAKPDGRPINPNTDYHEWKALLAGAGLRDARLHDARHTVATVLLILGVPTATAMALMGWSSAAMATRYQHLIDSIRRDVAKQVGGLLWEPDGPQPEDAEEPGPESGPCARLSVSFLWDEEYWPRAAICGGTGRSCRSLAVQRCHG
jgi:integrase